MLPSAAAVSASVLTDRPFQSRLNSNRSLNERPEAFAFARNESTEPLSSTNHAPVADSSGPLSPPSARGALYAPDAVSRRSATSRNRGARTLRLRTPLPFLSFRSCSRDAGSPQSARNVAPCYTGGNERLCIEDLLPRDAVRLRHGAVVERLVEYRILDALLSGDRARLCSGAVVHVLVESRILDPLLSCDLAQRTA